MSGPPSTSAAPRDIGPLEPAPSAVMALFGAWALPNAILLSMITVALPEIRREYAVSEAALSWVTSGYIIAGAVGAVIYGRVADVLGLRRGVLVCIGGLATSSVALAVAPAFWVVIASRVLQGMFGMALPSMGLGAILTHVPLAHRVRAVLTMMAFFGSGLVLGSAGGGVSIAVTNWRMPFAAVGVLALLLVTPTLKALAGVARSHRSRRLDGRWGALVAGAVVATLLAANQLPRRGGVTVGLAAAAVAIVAWPAFVTHLNRTSSPFVDPGVLRNRSFLLLCAVAGAMQAIFVGAGFVLPLALRDVFERSSTAIGLLLAPGFAGVLAMSLTGRRLTERLGVATMVGGSVAVGSVAVSAALVVGMRSEATLSLVFALLGVAYGASAPAFIAAVGRILPTSYSATGMGFYNFSFFAAGALAVAACGGIAERRVGAAQSWTGLYVGDGAGYADAFLVPALAVAAAGTLAVVLGRLGTFRAGDAASPTGGP